MDFENFCILNYSLDTVKYFDYFKTSIDYFNGVENVYFISDQFFKPYINKNYLDCDILINKIPLRLEQIMFYKNIKNIQRKKVYISSYTYINNLAPLLNINYGITIPDNLQISNLDTLINYKNEILSSCINLLNNESNLIILISAGVLSSLIIYELHKKFPNNIYIDINYAFDGLFNNNSPSLLFQMQRYYVWS